MGVIESPSSFSRRSPSGDDGFERFHPPIVPLRVPYPASLNPSSVILLAHPLLLASSFTFSFLPPTIFVSLVSQVALTIPLPCSPISLPPLCFLLSATAYSRRIRRYTHAFRLFYPLASFDPRVSSPRRALSVSLCFLLCNFPVVPPPSHPSSSHRYHPASSLTTLLPPLNADERGARRKKERREAGPSTILDSLARVA